MYRARVQVIDLSGCEYVQVNSSVTSYCRNLMNQQPAHSFLNAPLTNFSKFIIQYCQVFIFWLLSEQIKNSGSFTRAQETLSLLVGIFVIFVHNPYFGIKKTENKSTLPAHSIQSADNPKELSFFITILPGNHFFVLLQNPTSTNIRGTSISTPTTVANAAPEDSPNSITAVAMATSK